MTTLKRAFSVVALLSVSACGGPQEGQETAAALGTSAAQLATPEVVSIDGCDYTLTAPNSNPGSLPTYRITLTRNGSPSECYGAGESTILDTSFDIPSMQLVGDPSVGLVVGYSYKATPSGSTHSYIQLKRVWHNTFQVLRNDGLISQHDRGSSENIYLGHVSIGDDETLIVSGTQNGYIANQTGAGPHFIANFHHYWDGVDNNALKEPPSVVAF